MMNITPLNNSTVSIPAGGECCFYLCVNNVNKNKKCCFYLCPNITATRYSLHINDERVFT
jgi:hypothetical protein